MEKNGSKTEETGHRHLPSWLRIRVKSGSSDYRKMKERLPLPTVCEEARCPNISECFASGTATFLLMGSVCTRNCTYCNIGHGRPLPLNPAEPALLADTIRKLGLSYAVLTSVTRDDVPDGGARHFAACIRSIREVNPHCRVEILVPDFKKNMEDAVTVLSETAPDVFNHNIETVSSLFRTVRPGGRYEGSLELLKRYHEAMPEIPLKSGIMVGLGETEDELFQTFRDLRNAGVTLLSVGQYLSPGPGHAPVRRFVTPEEFDRYRREALNMGFIGCAAGPFVRSSYRASELRKLAGGL